ncbi:hypothetical protein [Streptomyces sp. st115]|uniref:hypothetical protein n=1 Tax=Streptomyces sp. st115 TaxID=1828047 RepID=UPI0015CF562B
MPREFDELSHRVELGRVLGDRGVEERRPDRGPACFQVDGPAFAVLAGEESEGVKA